MRHEPEPCRQKPNCGALITDRQAHRKWHERIFLSEKEPDDEEPRQRYIGVDLDRDQLRSVTLKGSV